MVDDSVITESVAPKPDAIVGPKRLGINQRAAHPVLPSTEADGLERRSRDPYRRGRDPELGRGTPAEA
jgi:hypothetical protein